MCSLFRLYRPRPVISIVVVRAETSALVVMSGTHFTQDCLYEQMRSCKVACTGVGSAKALVPERIETMLSENGNARDAEYLIHYRKHRQLFLFPCYSCHELCENIYKE
jgi:acetyl-CoA carboxylase carboxyltransferase component